MKRFILAAAASAAAIVAAAPASAATYVNDLGTISVPPDAFFTTPVMVMQTGAVNAYYNFTLTSAFTVNGASFTSTNPFAVAFNSVGVYSGTGVAGQTGAPTGTVFSFNNTQESGSFGNAIGFTPVLLQAGTYTIYLSGTANAN